jgi:hypothetical protein
MGAYLTGVYVRSVTGVHLIGVNWRVSHGRVSHRRVPHERTSHGHVLYERVYSRSHVLQMMIWWSICRDLSCQIRDFVIRDKRFLSDAAIDTMRNENRDV